MKNYTQTGLRLRCVFSSCPVPQVSHSFSLAHQRYNVTIAVFYDRGVSQTVEQVCPIKRLSWLKTQLDLPIDIFCIPSPFLH